MQSGQRTAPGPVRSKRSDSAAMEEASEFKAVMEVLGAEEVAIVLGTASSIHFSCLRTEQM